MPSQVTPPSSEPSFLTERELTSRWRVSVRTLQRRRHDGRDPDHLAIGNRILYPIAAVLAFEQRHLRQGEES